MLGEYGGIGMIVDDHVWFSKTDKGNWGYGGTCKSAEEVTSRYESFSKTMLPLLLQGLSGAIYTQTTDVEGEINGLVTYDRKVIKVDVKRIHDINQKVINSLK